MNIGDYIRTKYGKIGKIIGFNESIVFSPTTNKGKIEYVGSTVTGLDVDTNYDFDDKNDRYFENDIVKSSPNIRDLLEDGDYIKLQDRGWRYYEVTTDYESKLAIIDIGWNEYEDIDDIPNQEIISIVTHEQMEEMEYKINE